MLNIPVGIRFPTLQFGCVQTTRIMFVITICMFLLNQYRRLLQSQSSSRKYLREYAFRELVLFASTSSKEATLLESLSRHYYHEYRIIRKTLQRTFTYFHRNGKKERVRSVSERMSKYCVPLLHYFIIISFVRIKIS